MLFDWANKSILNFIWANFIRLFHWNIFYIFFKAFWKHCENRECENNNINWKKDDRSAVLILWINFLDYILRKRKASLVRFNLSALEKIIEILAGSLRKKNNFCKPRLLFFLHLQTSFETIRSILNWNIRASTISYIWPNEKTLKNSLRR